MTAVLENTCAPFAAVSGADLQVPLVDGTTCSYANFDYAASAPALAEVTERVAELLPFYSSVHRGAGYTSRVSTAAYEKARVTVSDFVGAQNDSVVIFTRNTTDSLNLLAGCVPGDTVVLDIEHHANLLPWRNRRVVQAGNSIAETLSALDAELAASPAALLAVTGASNVTGEVLPIGELADLAHRHGARIVVDGAQLVPHRRVDIAALGVDYLAFSGHKLYAPHGAGVLVGKRDWLDVGDPYLAGGGAVRHVTTTSTDWAPSPARHEAGTPNVLGVVALAAACDAVAAHDDAGSADHERRLSDRLRDGLTAVDGVALLNVWNDAPDSVGIVTFTVDGYGPGEIAAYLSAEHGIGVRDGKFCAHPLLQRLGHAGGAVRASLGLGSSEADVDRLVDAVAQLVEQGPSWVYEEDNGWWNPVPDPRPFPAVADGGSGVGSPCASGEVSIGS
ncbi:aminotransferase class V-fold PLP-dependent enzyme [Rhodococcoides kyotonense]|uniref:Selenocysteine lyase/Cysteine desulfurase n=1 Tax=Rhodococcoides kyotonense TaxID=398843 RepID=A0A239GUD2_9NOCA|nr:aminotransferase class V-fold PLP-dependent enzyme [Rhodococcus kyotonensis]SNS71674.1 Selenocysteine lyase/Cysteine desulfurase [Rhodococcus kyotonensis]